MNFSVNLTTPKEVLQKSFIFSPSDRMNSVLPPPISKVITLRFSWGIFQYTPSRVSLASSSHVIILISMPVSFFARRTNSCPFEASRTALVATAKRGGSPFSRQIWRNLESTFSVVCMRCSVSFPWASMPSPRRVMFLLETSRLNF